MRRLIIQEVTALVNRSGEKSEMNQKFAPGHSSVVSAYGLAGPVIVCRKYASVARNDSQPGVKHATVPSVSRSAVNVDSHADGNADFWRISGILNPVQAL